MFATGSSLTLCNIIKSTAEKNIDSALLSSKYVLSCFTEKKFKYLLFFF